MRDSHSHNHDAWIGRHVTGGSSSLSAPSRTARPRDPGLGKPTSRYPSGIRSFPVWSVSKSRSSDHHCLTERALLRATIGGPPGRGWFCSGSFLLNLVRGRHSHNHDVWIGRHVAGGSSSLSAPSRTARSREPGLGKPASRYPSGIGPFPGGSVSRSRSSGHHLS